ncbi:DNA binding protein [Aureococcus anophagefferens]|nr:DNA binding protein [Aureococcus anophagefferens]
MTDYYAVTGLDQKDASQFFAESSTCLVLAHPTNGAYASAFCEPGDTLYSGNGCHVDCDDGYVASGVTRCVEGAFVEYATLLILVGVACVVVACGVCYAAFYLHRREREHDEKRRLRWEQLEKEMSLEAADAGEAPPALPAPVDAGCAPGWPGAAAPRVEARDFAGRGDRWKKKKKKKKKKKDAPAPEPAWELTEDRDDAPFVL